MPFSNSVSIDPQVIERKRGGWLAVSPRGAAVRLGAAGASEAEARSRFAEIVAKWARYRDEEAASPDHL